MESETEPETPKSKRQQVETEGSSKEKTDNNPPSTVHYLKVHGENRLWYNIVSVTKRSCLTASRTSFRFYLESSSVYHSQLQFNCQSRRHT
jgi:hypothetical protein